MIKFLIISFLVTSTSYACNVSVTLKEAQRIIDAGARTSVVACKTQSGCVCADDIFWDCAEIIGGKLQNNPDKLKALMDAQIVMNQSLSVKEKRESDGKLLKQKLDDESIPLDDPEIRKLIKSVLR